MRSGLIEVATDVDLPALRALAVDDAISDYLAADTTDGLAEAVGNGEFLVVRDGDVIVGAVRSVLVNRRSRIVEARALMIAPAARGRGLGTTLVRVLCERAFGDGAHRVQAEVHADNPAALACFERAGFQREGVRRRAYDRRGGWQDAIHLGLLIDD